MRIVHVLRIWFLLGLPLAVASELAGYSHTALGSVWILAVAIPLGAMLALQPLWLARWLWQPVASLIRRIRPRFFSVQPADGGQDNRFSPYRLNRW